MLDIDSIPRSEYKKMLVWNGLESDAVHRIVVYKTHKGYHAVSGNHEEDFLKGNRIVFYFWPNAKPLPSKPKFNYHTLVGKTITWGDYEDHFASFDCHGVYEGELLFTNEKGDADSVNTHVKGLQYLNRSGEWVEVNEN